MSNEFDLLRNEGLDASTHLVIPEGPWLQDVYELVPDDGWRARSKADRPCVVPSCPNPSYLLSTRAADLPHGAGMCRGHSSRWVRAGRPAIDRFVPTQLDRPLRSKAPVRLSPDERLYTVDFTTMPRVLAQELRFAIATCLETRRWNPNPGLAQQLKAIAMMLSTSDSQSVLEETRESWGIRLKHVAQLQKYGPSLTQETVGCFSTVYEVLADAYTVDPWARDEWKTALFGIRAPHRQSIHWEKVTIPWLKDGLKKLARMQLSVNARKWTTIETWRRTAVTFCEFLDARGIEELEKSSLDRHLILDFFASMSSDSARARARVFVQLLYDLRQYEIVPELPDVVYLMRGEAVVKKTRRPRPYPPDVIERIDRLILESEYL